jgi:hypothetical protein
LLLQHAIAAFGANEVDVNEQNPQGVGFIAIWGLSRSDARNWTGRESVSVAAYEAEQEYRD